MRLTRPFIRMPWTFDAARMADEIAAIDDAAWMAHPSRLDGNSAVALISRDGQDNDEFEGAMLATPHLLKCAYVQQVLASFDEVLGRSRLMKLAAGAEVATHVDFNYHWYSRVRIHIPIITNDDVRFHCGPEYVDMQAGESWIFDSWRRHRVTNNGDADRIHLVVDTAGSAKFWNTVQQRQMMDPTEWTSATQQVNYEPEVEATLRTEQFNIAPIMAPGEMVALASDLIEDFKANTENNPQLVARYEKLLLDLCRDWRQVWAEFGYETAGLPRYRELIESAAAQLDGDPRALLTSSNKVGVNPIIVQRILRSAIASERLADFRIDNTAD